MIAGVTGATGLIGRRLVRMLKTQGYHIRALSREAVKSAEQVEFFQGGLQDEAVINRILTGAQYLFHCAGEREDSGRMRAVNVEGTRQLVRIARRHSLQYFCHVSSAGVIGKTRKKVIDESCDCCPQSLYEQTKFEAEQAVAIGIEGCRVVILRPTNVVAAEEPGILSAVTQPTLKNKFKLILSGSERTHIVHAKNVAAAALHLKSLPDGPPEVFIVSADHEQGTRLNEIAELYGRLCKSEKTPGGLRVPALPLTVPYVLRKLLGRGGNPGDVVYSSRKLRQTGFSFPVSVAETVAIIADGQGC